VFSSTNYVFSSTNYWPLKSNNQGVQILFQALDVDSSGTLSLEKFMNLTSKASAANHVVDYIPLVEIMDVQAELHRRDGVTTASRCQRKRRVSLLPKQCYKQATSLRQTSTTKLSSR